MAISSNNTLLNMSITVKELGNKHQLNPNNTGVTAIDRCMCLVNNELGISDLLSIRVFEENLLFAIDTGSSVLAVPNTTLLLKESGKYGCIADGSLNMADRLLTVQSNGIKSYVEIHDIRPTTARTLTYKIRTLRGNYILSNGIIVKSD